MVDIGIPIGIPGIEVVRDMADKQQDKVVVGLVVYMEVYKDLDQELGVGCKDCQKVYYRAYWEGSV